MTIMRLCVALTSTLLLTSMPAETATTYHVSATGGNDAWNGLTWATAKRTIQGALSPAIDSDTILVSNGTYYLASELTISKSVTLVGLNGAASTIIDGSNSCRCIHITSGSPTIQGFSIRHGFLSDDIGAGVLARSGGVLRDCEIYRNVASNADRMVHHEGGGLFIEGTTRIEDCKIYSNETHSAHGGGGIKLQESARMTRCEVYGNFSAGSGGGVRAAHAAVVEDCDIHSNGGYYGTGVNVSDDAVYSRCRVHNNSAGGVWLAGGTMLNCLIYSNINEGVAARGGALRNCVISDHAGDGIYVQSDEGPIQNCTITRNGVGVSLDSEVYATNVFRNLILYGNLTGTNYVSPTNSVFACDFSCVDPIPSSGVGNISSDPLLANAAQSDFRLRGDSPCVDAGTNLSWMLGATDLEGQPRVFNVQVDMGADETYVAALGMGCTGQVSTLWQSVVRARHQFQCSTNLLSPNWFNIGGVSTSSQWQTTVVDTNPVGMFRLYRLLWLRP